MFRGGARRVTVVSTAIGTRISICWLSALLAIAIFIVVINASSSSKHTSSSSSSGKTRTSSFLRSSTGSISMSSANALVPPPMLYGTAWKKDATEEMVKEAIRNGFRWFDTACQPKHYNEKGLGDGIAGGGVDRKDLFIQTKFTPLRGQDPKSVPYDSTRSLTEQVRQSLERSLENLRTTYIDSMLIHSPLDTLEDTMTAYHELEVLVQEKKVLYIGMSNLYDIEMLRQIYSNAVVKPSFIQNRFYRDSGYDVDIRKFCRNNGMHYQSFWTLSANPHILRSAGVRSISSRLGKTPEQVFFAFVRSQGIIFLTGTKDSKHMAEDLDVPNITLSEDDVSTIADML